MALVKNRVIINCFESKKWIENCPCNDKTVSNDTGKQYNPLASNDNGVVKEFAAFIGIPDYILKHPNAFWQAFTANVKSFATVSTKVNVDVSVFYHALMHQLNHDLNTSAHPIGIIRNNGSNVAQMKQIMVQYNQMNVSCIHKNCELLGYQQIRCTNCNQQTFGVIPQYVLKLPLKPPSGCITFRFNGQIYRYIFTDYDFRFNQSMQQWMNPMWNIFGVLSNKRWPFEGFHCEPVYVNKPNAIFLWHDQDVEHKHIYSAYLETFYPRLIDGSNDEFGVYAFQSFQFNFCLFKAAAMQDRYRLRFKKNESFHTVMSDYQYQICITEAWPVGKHRFGELFPMVRPATGGFIYGFNDPANCRMTANYFINQWIPKYRKDNNRDNQTLYLIIDVANGLHNNTNVINFDQKPFALYQLDLQSLISCLFVFVKGQEKPLAPYTVCFCLCDHKQHRQNRHIPQHYSGVLIGIH